MAGALAGVRVIDFGHYIAGPLAAVMLSDQGADVIHVDPPAGWGMESTSPSPWGTAAILSGILLFAVVVTWKRRSIVDRFRRFARR